jgi:SOS response regulatory protein OraA/RecX
MKLILDQKSHGCARTRKRLPQEHFEREVITEVIEKILSVKYFLDSAFIENCKLIL